MTVLLLVRIAIWLTFFLLIAGEVAATIFARQFYLFYLRKHKELEVRVGEIEQRVHWLEEGSK